MRIWRGGGNGEWWGVSYYVVLLFVWFVVTVTIGHQVVVWEGGKGGGGGLVFGVEGINGSERGRIRGLFELLDVHAHDWRVCCMDMLIDLDEFFEGIGVRV